MEEGSLGGIVLQRSKLTDRRPGPHPSPRAAFEVL